MSEKWAGKDKRKSLINQRKHLWTDNMINNIATMSGMLPGLKVADIGCGLGYLGQIYSPYFAGGEYTGIDVSKKLLKEARKNSKEWASDVKCCFREGNAYSIPIKDNSMDITMCQTLLMHLNEPDKAMKEMIRITRLGGVLLCKEPDNVSAGLRLRYSSMPELSFEDKMKLIKAHLMHEKGRKALGEGDWQIGAKVPHMMQKLGMNNIEVVCNDLVRFALPPYSTPQEQHLVKMAKEFATKDMEEKKKEAKEYSAIWRKRMKAGGASDYFIRKVFKLGEKWREQHQNTFKEQIEKGTYHIFSGAGSFYCIIGRKHSK